MAYVSHHPLASEKLWTHPRQTVTVKHHKYTKNMWQNDGGGEVISLMVMGIIIGEAAVSRIKFEPIVYNLCLKKEQIQFRSNSIRKVFCYMSFIWRQPYYPVRQKVGHYYTLAHNFAKY